MSALIKTEVDGVVDFTPGELFDGKVVVEAAQLARGASTDPVMVKVNSGAAQLIVAMGDQVAVVDPVGEGRRIVKALCEAIKEATKESSMQVINAAAVNTAVAVKSTMFGADRLSSVTVGQAMTRAATVYAQAVQVLAATDQVAAEKKAPQLGTDNAWKGMPRPR